MKYKRTTMCSECPFRKVASQGWLGPWTIDEVEGTVLSDRDFACHKDVTRLIASGKAADEDDIEARGLAQHCVGFLRYMSSLFKMSRDPAKAAFQTKLKTVPDQELIPPRQFRAHHEDLGVRESESC